MHPQPEPGAESESVEEEDALDPVSRGLLNTENCRVFRELPHFGQAMASPLPRTIFS